MGMRMGWFCKNKVGKSIQNEVKSHESCLRAGKQGSLENKLYHF